MIDNTQKSPTARWRRLKGNDPARTELRRDVLAVRTLGNNRHISTRLLLMFARSEPSALAHNSDL
jgi:hypothetical protein